MASVKVGSEITNMTEKCFGFGIVGAGVIAHFHARAIAAIPNAHLLVYLVTTRVKQMSLLSITIAMPMKRWKKCC